MNHQSYYLELIAKEDFYPKSFLDEGVTVTIAPRKTPCDVKISGKKPEKDSGMSGRTGRPSNGKII